MQENIETIKNLPFSELIGEYVLILTKDRLTYHAKILDVSDLFLKFIDKYGKIVSISLSNIQQVTEVTG